MLTVYNFHIKFLFFASELFYWVNTNETQNRGFFSEMHLKTQAEIGRPLTFNSLNDNNSDHSANFPQNGIN